jgi:hypothetical protein
MTPAVLPLEIVSVGLPSSWQSDCLAMHIDGALTKARSTTPATAWPMLRRIASKMFGWLVTSGWNIAGHGTSGVKSSTGFTGNRNLRSGYPSTSCWLVLKLVNSKPMAESSKPNLIQPAGKPKCWTGIYKDGWRCFRAWTVGDCGRVSDDALRRPTGPTTGQGVAPAPKNNFFQSLKFKPRSAARIVFAKFQTRTISYLTD